MGDVSGAAGQVALDRLDPVAQVARLHDDFVAVAQARCACERFDRGLYDLVDDRLDVGARPAILATAVDGAQVAQPGCALSSVGADSASRPKSSGAGALAAASRARSSVGASSLGAALVDCSLGCSVSPVMLRAYPLAIRAPRE